MRYFQQAKNRDKIKSTQVTTSQLNKHILAAVGVLCVLSPISCSSLPRHREPQSWIWFYHFQECFHTLLPIFNKEKKKIQKHFFLWWIHKHPVCIRTNFLIPIKRDPLLFLLIWEQPFQKEMVCLWEQTSEVFREVSVVTLCAEMLLTAFTHSRNLIL